MYNFTNHELSMIDRGWKNSHKNYKLQKGEIKKIRICAYLRKSQEDVKDNSLKLQLDEINKFINSINILHSKEYEFYYDKEDIFQEDNVSGMQGRARPEFDRMLKYIENNPGYYGVCLVYKLDRFSRKLEDTLSFITLISKKNCVLKALDFEDNGDPSSALLRAMLGIVAQYHAQNSAVTSIKGTTKKVEENKAVGLLPIGLIQEKVLNKDSNMKGASKIVIDESKAPIVREIFQKYANGVGITEITNYLEKKGYKNNLGKPISSQNVKYILNNKRYNGTYVYADPTKIKVRKYDNGVKKPEYYEKHNVIPKIIEDDLWNKVQLILQSKRNSHQLSNKFSNNYLLTDYLICGYCKKNLHGWSRSKSNNKKYYDYVCSTHKKDLTICPTKRINRDYLEKVVVKIMLSILNKIIKDMKNDFLFLVNKKLNNVHTEIISLKKEINYHKEKISKLIDRIIDDEKRTSFYDEKIKEEEEKIETLNEKLTNCNLTINCFNKQFDSIKDNFILTEEIFLNDIAMAKVFISLLIENIYVTNEKINIKLKVKSKK